MTDIHHQARGARKDVHHGDHGTGATSPEVVLEGVQEGCRGPRAVVRQNDRRGGPGPRPHRVGPAGVGAPGRHLPAARSPGPPITSGPTTSRRAVSSTTRPWASASRPSTTRAEAPTAGPGCTGRCGPRASTPAASGWPASCARKAWWDGVGAGGPRRQRPTLRRRPSTCSSAPSAPAPLSWTGSTWVTSPTSGPGRAGPTWRRSSISPPGESWAGQSPITCEHPSSAMHCAWPLRPADPGRG